MDVSSLKVAELKKECASRGISVTGLRKAGLVEALEKAIKKESSSKASTSAPKAAAPKKRKRAAATTAEEAVEAEQEEAPASKPAAKRAKGKAKAKAKAAPAAVVVVEEPEEEELGLEDIASGIIYAPSIHEAFGTTAAAPPAVPGAVPIGQPVSEFFKHQHHSNDRNRPNVRLVVHEPPKERTRNPNTAAQPHRRNNSTYGIVSTIDHKSIESSNIKNHNRLAVRGGNVSDRNWKQPGQRASSKIATRPGGTGIVRGDGSGDVSANPKNVMSAAYASQQRKREQKKRVQQLQRELKEKDSEKKRALREAKEERLKRKQDNEFASSTVQSLGKNMATKLKNMTKKQLRQIKKTRMTSNGSLEYVSPFQK
jgi:hypothetical protein